MKPTKKIGIIGGNGSQASVELYRLMIEKASKDFGAINNEESVPGAINKLKKVAQELVNLGCDAIAISCNSIHLLEKEVRTITGNTFISLLDYSVGKLYEKQLPQNWTTGVINHNKEGFV